MKAIIKDAVWTGCDSANSDDSVLMYNASQNAAKLKHKSVVAVIASLSVFVFVVNRSFI